MTTSNKHPVTSNSLPVMETFLSLQGEGYYAGQSAFFIRLAGCDVGCTWCDVKESWDETKHPSQRAVELADMALQSKSHIAVITGGEPTLYDLSALTEEIKSKGLRTHIETSGTNPLTGKWDWITFSPKRFKKPLAEYFQNSHELKIIIAHKNDLRWAKEFEEKMNPDCHLYIQPEWDNRKEMESLCIDFVKENPNWKLSLQTHKYLGID
jgi:organic radical activating enzyme